ncbi:LOW QUALITY PROTEIN: hypothetical protein ElyMa_003376900 [Elysia marginata]|uniref:BHLH domain-containing protein n=1 Tax=Elysia marginata TaxID=1093978 RepID=A0AAV4JM10_9GAST|nr:LOW QUALITY PROTEIN: hypothetical protein ElyMa_003376900 [Elysia marginata]
MASLGSGVKGDEVDSRDKEINRVTSLRLQQAFEHISSIKSRLITPSDTSKFSNLSDILSICCLPRHDTRSRMNGERSTSPATPATLAVSAHAVPPPPTPTLTATATVTTTPTPWTVVSAPTTTQCSPPTPCLSLLLTATQKTVAMAVRPALSNVCSIITAQTVTTSTTYTAVTTTTTTVTFAALAPQVTEHTGLDSAGWAAVETVGVVVVLAVVLVMDVTVVGGFNTLPTSSSSSPARHKPHHYRPHHNTSITSTPKRRLFSSQPSSDISGDSSQPSCASLPNLYLKPGSETFVFRPLSARSSDSFPSETLDDQCTTTSGSYSVTMDDQQQLQQHHKNHHSPHHHHLQHQHHHSRHSPSHRGGTPQGVGGGGRGRRDSSLQLADLNHIQDVYV